MVRCTKAPAGRSCVAGEGRGELACVSPGSQPLAPERRKARLEAAQRSSGDSEIDGNEGGEELRGNQRGTRTKGTFSGAHVTVTEGELAGIVAQTRLEQSSSEQYNVALEWK